MSKPGKQHAAAVEVGEKVKARRLELGLSQAELAKRARMSTGKVSELENARSGSRGPTLGRLVQVAKALKVKTSALLDC